jgi:hypothetical protein
MQISSRYINKEILNLSVSGASIEDQITLGILSLKKFTPKIVYLAADPWLFNRNSGQTRYQTLNQEFLNSVEYISNKLEKKSEIKMQLESDTTSLALSIFGKFNLKFLKTEPIDELPGFYDKIRYDGSRIYNTKYQNLPLSNIRNGFDDVYGYSMTNYVFDNQSFNKYENFIEYLKLKGIKVILVFSPYHPELYYKINTNKSFEFAQNKFIELSKEKSILIIGSYNPDKCNCKSFDFYDGMHPKDKCMNNILINSNTF